MRGSRRESPRATPRRWSREAPARSRGRSRSDRRAALRPRSPRYLRRRSRARPRRREPGRPSPARRRLRWRRARPRRHWPGRCAPSVSPRALGRCPLALSRSSPIASPSCPERRRRREARSPTSRGSSRSRLREEIPQGRRSDRPLVIGRRREPRRPRHRLRPRPARSSSTGVPRAGPQAPAVTDCQRSVNAVSRVRSRCQPSASSREGRPVVRGTSTGRMRA